MLAIACVLLVSSTLSAGVYGLDDARRVTTATSWSKWAEFKTANPLDYTEIAIFSQDDDEKYALITSVVPLDTDWFGYHIFPADVDAEILQTILSGNSIETDPSVDIGYMFRLDHLAQTVSGLSQWGSYLGAIPEYFQDSPAVFECQREYAAKGDICRFNETLGEGDFMTKIQGVMLIGLRDQIPQEQDLEIVNIVWGDETVRVTWKRSLGPPFDSNSLRVRYGRSPLDSAAADELPLSFEPIHGFNYHGTGGGVSQVITFQKANATTPPSVNSDGELLSEWIDPATLLVGGGSIGWSPLGNLEFEGYATVTVPVGTTIRFTYFILIPVVTIATVADTVAFDACDMTNATQIGGLLDSPVDVVMNQPGVHYFVSDYASPATRISSCEAGAKIKVVVESDEDATSNPPPAPGKMAAGPTSSKAGRGNLSPLSALLGIIAFGTLLLFGV